jgi:hypothetical protein
VLHSGTSSQWLTNCTNRFRLLEINAPDLKWGHVARSERPDAGGRASGHPDRRVRSPHAEPNPRANSSICLRGSINRSWPASSYLSWTFDILDILVSWANSLPLISLAWLWIQSKIEWFQVYLLEWLHLVAYEDCCRCGFLVTLGGSCHLDGLEQWWRSNTCWWLFVAGFGDLVRAIAPSPTKRRKVALVNCSCHWVTSLVGRFLWCPTCGRGSCNTS